MNAMDTTIESSETLHEDIPTLASSAMIVEVNISMWTARRKDHAATKMVLNAYNAQKGVGGFHKKLLADNENLLAITKHVTSARDAHANMTMPWSNSGLRLLPTAQFFKYQQTMTDKQNEFNRLVDQFIDEYDDAVIDVQVALGNLFSRDDYPTTGDLPSKFKFNINYSDVPTGDFRVALPAEAIAKLTTNRNADHQNNLERAMNDVWTRLYKALTNMSDRLDYGSKEEKKVFRDTLVSNVIDMIELLRVCNVTNSSQMSAMADSLEEAMSGVTPDALREDDYFRAETKAAVDAAIKSLPSLDI